MAARSEAFIHVPSRGYKSHFMRCPVRVTTDLERGLRLTVQKDNRERREFWSKSYYTPKLGGMC